jgi:predicted transcriptional regulator
LTEILKWDYIIPKRLGDPFVSHGRTPHKLTPFELDIMKALWETGPATVRTVQQHGLLERRKLAYNTVQTMLNILHRKGKVERRKEGRSFLYQPVVERQQVIRATLSDVLDRLFEGDAERLVLSLLDTKQLTREKLNEISEFLEKEPRADGDGK